MIKYKEGYLYRVEGGDYVRQTNIIPPRAIEHPCYSLSASGLVTLRSGLFAWDGATWCLELLVPKEASAVHDMFCQEMENGGLDWVLYSPQVHDLLREMVAERKWEWWASLVKEAVVLARAGHPSHVNNNPVLTDP